MKINLIDLKKEKISIDSEQELVGLFILSGNDEITGRIEFIHSKPGIFSRINLKFILLDNAKLDLEAVVRIEKSAPQTNTYLKIDALNISENSSARVIPSMEIKVDDVKGGHGATVGMLDENQLWYLKSRGLSESEARKMMILGFIDDFVKKVDNKIDLKDKIQSLDQLL